MPSQYVHVQNTMSSKVIFNTNAFQKDIFNDFEKSIKPLYGELCPGINAFAKHNG